MLGALKEIGRFVAWLSLLFIEGSFRFLLRRTRGGKAVLKHIRRGINKIRRALDII